MEEIESLEQTLIQHLRTSGLRQAREVSLVEEVLEIRKRRRQIFSSLENQAKEASIEAGKAAKAAEIERDEIKEKFIQLKKQQKDELLELQQAWDEREQSLIQHEEDHIESLKKEWGKKFDKLRNGYVDEVKTLEDKIAKLTRENEMMEKKIMETMSMKVKNELREEYQKQYDDKVAEYKSSVAAMALRERETLEDKEKLQRILESMKLDYSNMTTALMNAQKKIEDITRREKSLELKNIKLAKDNETLAASNISMATQLNKIEEDCNQKLQSQETKHKQLLDTIDEKMRKVLEHKQQELHKVKMELLQERKKYDELNTMLKEIAGET